MSLEPSALFQGVFTKGFGDGTGFSASAGQGAGTAVDGQHQQHDGIERADCFLCSSAEDISRILGIGGSVGGGNALFSVKAKIDFANSINMSATDVVIIAAAMQQETFSGTTFGPRSDVQYFSKAEGFLDHQRFTQTYGMAFISEITVGGKFFAYFKIRTSSIAEKQQTMASFSGSIGVQTSLNANAAVQLQNTLANARSTKQVESSYTVIGGQQVQARSDSDLINFAQKFPSLPLSSRAVMAYQVSDYRSAGIS